MDGACWVCFCCRHSPVQDMNVRIFWVRAMKCMRAQTRPRFILSSERVFGGMEFEPMLTPREKSPLPENVPRGGSNPRRCGQRAQALPTELFRPPTLSYTDSYTMNMHTRCVMVNIEGFRPYHAWDTPFWPGTLDMHVKCKWVRGLLKFKTIDEDLIICKHFKRHGDQSD